MTYLEYTNQVFDDDPVTIIQFVLSQLERLVHSYLSIALLYVSAYFIMSYIEFHHITTSHFGIPYTPFY